MDMIIMFKILGIIAGVILSCFLLFGCDLNHDVVKPTSVFPVKKTGKETVAILDEVDKFTLSTIKRDSGSVTLIFSFIIFDRDPVEVILVCDKQIESQYLAHNIYYEDELVTARDSFSVMKYPEGKLTITGDDEINGTLFSTADGDFDFFSIIPKLDKLRSTDNISFAIGALSGNGETVNVGWTPMVKVKDFVKAIKDAGVTSCPGTVFDNDNLDITPISNEQVKSFYNKIKG